MVCVQDVEFAFEKERLPEWIADIKHLIKKDLRSIPGWFAHRRQEPAAAAGSAGASLSCVVVAAAV